MPFAPEGSGSQRSIGAHVSAVCKAKHFLQSSVVWCVREVLALVTSSPPQGVLVRGKAGLAITKNSLVGEEGGSGGRDQMKRNRPKSECWSPSYRNVSPARISPATGLNLCLYPRVG